jgi:hypothetical protein
VILILILILLYNVDRRIETIWRVPVERTKAKERRRGRGTRGMRDFQIDGTEV